MSELKTKSRRVEPSLRKRAEFSCDRCKKRRRKCVPSPTGSSCQLCKENGASCTTTIPRKRDSGSQAYCISKDTHTLSSLTNQLVAKLFPKFEARDISQLAYLTEYVEKIELQIHVHGDELSVTSNGSLVQPVAHASTCVPSTVEQPLCLGNENPDATPSAVELSRPEVPRLNCDLGSRYERLLQNASGSRCYFGPSSSMAFVMQLREEVIYNASHAKDDTQPKQQQHRQSFAVDGALATMETLSQTETPSCEGGDQAAKTISPFSDIDHLSNHGGESQPVGCSRLHRLKSALPSRPEVEEMVEAYFIHIHPNMVLFYRPLFQNALEGFWTSSREYQTIGWISCFCLVIAFGCKHAVSASSYNGSSRSRTLCKTQQNLADIAMENVIHLIQHATLQSVQALALVSLYLNTQNQRNASWVMMGCAIKMAMSLGMHRDETLIQQKTRSTYVEVELKKRVWWSLYVSEQYSCALFGRPSTIDESETNNILPSESLLDEGYRQPPGLLYHDICLARLVGRIRRLQSSQNRSSKFSAGDENLTSRLPEIQAVRDILCELDTWDYNLPPFLKLDVSKQDSIYPGHVRPLIVIRLRYQHARLLLTRPFHLNAIQWQSLGCPEEAAIQLGDVCVASALESWRWSQQLFKHGRFNGDTWLDGVFLYQAGMVLALACLDREQKLHSTRTSDIRESVRQAVVQIPKMLHSLPQDNPMGRMVQIVEDFSKIVLSMKPASATSAADSGCQQNRHDHQSSSGYHSSIPMMWPQISQPEMNPPYENPTNVDMLLGSETRWQLGEGIESDPEHKDEGYLESVWNAESTQLMDYMLDSDLSHIFGFDGGPHNSTLFVD